jgi:NADH-quinone oxidoreductase subunit N
MSSEVSGISPELLLPELIMLAGLVALIIVPNIGDARFRIPLTSLRIPTLFGGTRFEITRDPRIPNRITIATLLASLAAAQLGLLSPGGWSGEVGNVLLVDEFSILMTNIFVSFLFLCAVATTHRIPADPGATAPKPISAQPSSAWVARKTEALYDNRRQVDFHILLLTTGLGMSLMAKSTHLFMLFVCMELASLSSYVLVGFHKESEEGGEAGTKYFIVGSVASAVGIYGMSLLYLWNGDLSISGLSSSWQSMEQLDPLATAGIGMMLVAFGFKVGAAPFHLAIPDAYSGASSIVAGMLATASKAMGFVALLRVMLLVSMPVSGEAFWFFVMAVISVVTMTWGNLAALSSDNPKRVLAYSSVAHAGYMLAAVAAIGSGLADAETKAMIATAILFHLSVLVVFKLGAFLVLSTIETEGDSHRIEGLHGLARRDPLIAGSMFVFMLSLAGVPPFSGFLSKLLMINGIVTASAGTGGASSILSWASSVEPVFWLAVAVVLNSALSLFYYLRIGLVMFFEPHEGTAGLSCNFPLRPFIMLLAVLSMAFGIGPASEFLVDIASDAAGALLP